MPILTVLIIGLLFVMLIRHVANKYDEGKKKIRKHIKNGDIDPLLIDNEFFINPESTTQTLFREMTNT